MGTKTDFRDAKRKIKKLSNQLKKELPDVLSKEIIGSIERGVSPVKGGGRFKAYSQSYKEAIKNKRFPGKKQRPVNLKLTGELLKSLKVRVKRNGLIIRFDNFLAVIHNNRGAGKSKAIRRMLPTNNGEEFSRSITVRLREVYSRIAKNIFKR